MIHLPINLTNFNSYEDDNDEINFPIGGPSDMPGY
jgi:hypothetical protein